MRQETPRFPKEPEEPPEALESELRSGPLRRSTSAAPALGLLIGVKSEGLGGGLEWGIDGWLAGNTALGWNSVLMGQNGAIW